MANPDLLKYIRERLQSFATQEEIQGELLAAGWSLPDIADGFATIKAGPSALQPSPMSYPPAQSPTTSPLTRFSGSPTTPGAILGGEVHRSKKWILWLVVALILLLIGGGAAFAYTKKTWPFGGVFELPSFLKFLEFKKTQAPELQTVGDVFTQFGKIKSASYALTLGIESHDRDADAQPIVLEFPEFDEQQPMYDRDAKRFQFVRDLELTQAFRTKQYPKALKDITNVLTDPLGKPYQYEPTPDGGDFKLTVTFETTEAIEELQNDRYVRDEKRAKIEGKTATFNKDSQLAYYFEAKPKRPAFVEFFSNQNDLFDFLPGNIKVAINVGGTTQKENNVVDGRFQGGADIQFEDFIINADVEFLKKGDTFYGRVNKFPGLFFDISKIKGKWVKFTLADLVGAGYGTFGFDAGTIEEGSRTKSNLALQQLQLFFKVADEESALTLTKSGAPEVSGDQTLNHFTLAFNKEKLPAFYQKLTDAFKAQFDKKSFIKFDERTLAYLKAPSFDGIFNYLSKNGSFELWTDEETGYPVKFKYSFRLVPGDKVSKLKNKQINLSATVALTDINKPVSITEPNEAMSFEDAQLALTGKTKDEYLLEKQENSVQSLQLALNIYRDLAGSYPDTLEQLKITGTDAKKLNSGTPKGEINDPRFGARYSYGNTYKDRLLLQAIPSDAFTGNPFEYKKSGDTFTLAYTIKLPPYVPGTIAPSVMKTDYSTCSGRPCSIASLKFVEGKNTATEKILSQEALAQAKIDSDRDFASDSLEMYIGTDKNKADTDGDGEQDGDEISDRKNPLGPGELEGPYY